MIVNNWEKWQTFRKDRGTPPWIKVYRNLLSNEQWAILTDSEKGQLVSIWILAADKSGKIPDNPKMIQKMAMLDELPNINKFIDLGFLLLDRQPDGDQVVTSCPQLDAPEESRVETEESRVETLAKPKSAPIPYKEIVDLYNSILTCIPSVKILNNNRKRLIKQLWHFHPDHKDLNWWREYFEYVSTIGFLTGKKETTGKYKNWKADFEWLVHIDNFTKIIEGKYNE